MSEKRENRYHDNPHHPSNWCKVCGLYFCWHPECETHRNDGRANHPFVPNIQELIIPDKKYTKIKLSKCHKIADVYEFKCVICNKWYHLNSENCQGVICCICQESLKKKWPNDDFILDYIYKIEKESYEILEGFNAE